MIFWFALCGLFVLAVIFGLALVSIALAMFDGDRGRQ